MLIPLLYFVFSFFSSKLLLGMGGGIGFLDTGAILWGLSSILFFIILLVVIGKRSARRFQSKKFLQVILTLVLGIVLIIVPSTIANNNSSQRGSTMYIQKFDPILAIIAEALKTENADVCDQIEESMGRATKEFAPLAEWDYGVISVDECKGMVAAKTGNVNLCACSHSTDALEKKLYGRPLDCPSGLRPYCLAAMAQTLEDPMVCQLGNVLNTRAREGKFSVSDDVRQFSNNSLAKILDGYLEGRKVANIDEYLYQKRKEDINKYFELSKIFNEYLEANKREDADEYLEKKQMEDAYDLLEKLKTEDADSCLHRYAVLTGDEGSCSQIVNEQERKGCLLSAANEEFRGKKGKEYCEQRVWEGKRDLCIADEAWNSNNPLMCDAIDGEKFPAAEGICRIRFQARREAQ